MPKAGLFAGEVTESAPIDGALTTKQKGYHWMQWGTPAPRPFVFKITVNDTTFTMPTPQYLWDDVTPAVYDYTVDWGTGEPEENITSWSAFHDYTGYDGEYTITISGTMDLFRCGEYSPSNDEILITEFTQWGSVWIKELQDTFQDCVNMQYIATDAPELAGATSLYRMFRNAGNNVALATADFSGWVVDDITDFQDTFFGCGYNPNVGGWDVSSSTTFDEMFDGAVRFNQDISGWDVAASTTFHQMFTGCTLFNADLSSWNVSGGVSFNSMFANTAVNFDLSGWTPTKADGFFRFLEGTNMSVANYDLLLAAWSLLAFDNSGYQFWCSAQYTNLLDHQSLESPPFSWAFTDGGLQP